MLNSKTAFGNVQNAQFFIFLTVIAQFEKMTSLAQILPQFISSGVA
jgi:hypothetical protein